MAKRIVKITRDKNELSFICTECGNFSETIEEMDTHLYRKHGSPVYIRVSELVN